MKLLAVAIIVAVALSGCGSKDVSKVSDPVGPQASDGLTKGSDQLHGYVVDNAIVPVEGAVISIHGENATSTTDKDGYFGFNGLDTERLLTIQVVAQDFKPQTRSLTLLPEMLTQLNFTLIPVPVEVARVEVESFTGHIECSALVRAMDERYPYDCAAVSAVDNRVWDFNVGSNVAGIIIEAFWNYDTELSSHLNLTVETRDLGIFDEILAQEEGLSPLRAHVTTEQANRFYRQGGAVKVSIDIGRNIEAEEMAAGAGLAIDQEVQLIASIFYVAPPPPGYTIDP